MATLLAAEPVPMIVVGGFLGAGKTTLLNHWLREPHGRRLAVLVNDFGDIAIDEALIAAHDGDTISFANGCVCCTLGDSLVRTLDTLLARTPPPDVIVVEASGVADPAAIAEVATLEPRLSRDVTIVLADADTLLERATDPLLADTLQRQLASASLVMLNKCDLVDASRRREVRRWLDGGVAVPVVEFEHARLPFDTLGTLLDETRSVTAQPNRRADAAHPFRTAVVPFETTTTEAVLRAWLSNLPATVVRAKGCVDTERGARLAERVGARVSVGAWPGSTDAPRAVVTLEVVEQASP